MTATTLDNDESFGASDSKVVNAFTVDVEDYYQVSAFDRYIPRSSWGSQESRVASSTLRILDLLDQAEVKGTFFVLGWVADQHPDLVREIQRRGHEIASHSYWHRLVYEQSPEEFRQDLMRSREVLQQITGQAITAYRAPSFSITAKSMWALEILAEEGFRVDSSIFPIRHDRYGVPGAQDKIHTIKTSAGTLIEFPPSVFKLGRTRLPISGGGYFRLYPQFASAFALARVNRSKQPFMFYIHPWEVDPGQPRMPHGSYLTRFRHYVGLAATEQKLGKLLGQFRFGRLSDVLDASFRQSCGLSDQIVDGAAALEHT